jgi:hypothetical protein
MFGFKRDSKKEFWRWLASHRREIHEDITGSAPAESRRWSINELGRRLRAVDADLVHEIGMADPSTIELIVSADGMKAAFRGVIDLVQSAPPLDGFKITAFRPRCGDGLQLEVAGQTITDQLLTYRLISEGDLLGLELFIDSDLAEKVRSMVGFLSLDQRLGEYDVATGLKWIEFAGGRPADALPITGLAHDFDSRRGVVVH